MRKFLLFFMAALVLSSCDNLKKKSDAGDEDEVLVKKKKKTVAEDEEDEEVYTPKKKQASNDDEEEYTPSTQGWTSTAKQQFMDVCVGEAEKNVSSARAREYCNCAMKEAQKIFDNYEDMGEMTETQKDKISASCN